uniref:Uncharacterized protein n=1 Tax=Arundo donax TaxID=35708 RepID=A0A0A8Y5F4_ARUDO
MLFSSIGQYFVFFSFLVIDLKHMDAHYLNAPTLSFRHLCTIPCIHINI